MDILQEVKDTSSNKKTFFSHVFSNTEEDKAEIMNVVQYGLLAVVPVVVLNKLIQRFIPEADTEKSSLELLAEIFIQLVVILCGIIIIHRIISFIPTYSGFKYEHLSLTNVILAFLVILLSIQTKLGIKVNILVDRVYDLWNGNSYDDDERPRKNVKVSKPMSAHTPSQADYLDSNQIQQGVFPPAPAATTKQGTNGYYDTMMKGGISAPSTDYSSPLMPANSLIGGSFGSFF